MPKATHKIRALLKGTQDSRPIGRAPKSIQHCMSFHCFKRAISAASTFRCPILVTPCHSGRRVSAEQRSTFKFLFQVPLSHSHTNHTQTHTHTHSHSHTPQGVAPAPGGHRDRRAATPKESTPTQPQPYHGGRRDRATTPKESTPNNPTTTVPAPGGHRDRAATALFPRSPPLRRLLCAATDPCYQATLS
jgi:hypothetical protein